MVRDGLHAAKGVGRPGQAVGPVVLVDGLVAKGVGHRSDVAVAVVGVPGQARARVQHRRDAVALVVAALDRLAAGQCDGCDVAGGVVGLGDGHVRAVGDGGDTAHFIVIDRGSALLGRAGSLGDGNDVAGIVADDGGHRAFGVEYRCKVAVFVVGSRPGFAALVGVGLGQAERAERVVGVQAGEAGLVGDRFQIAGGVVGVRRSLDVRRCVDVRIGQLVVAFPRRERVGGDEDLAVDRIVAVAALAPHADRLRGARLQK